MNSKCGIQQVPGKFHLDKKKCHDSCYVEIHEQKNKANCLNVTYIIEITESDITIKWTPKRAQNECLFRHAVAAIVSPSLSFFLPLPLSPLKCIFRMSWESIHFRYARLPKSTAIMISKNVLNFFCVAVLCIVLACLRKFYKFIEKWKELTFSSRSKYITERNQRN